MNVFTLGAKKKSPPNKSEVSLLLLLMITVLSPGFLILLA